MIENSPEHFGWSAMCREANGCFPTREAFMKGLAAYDAARPKLPTITGLPEALPDGTQIVGWRYDRPEIGDWCYELETCDFYRAWTDGRGYVAFIAITEADNG